MVSFLPKDMMTVVRRDGSEEQRPASNVYGTKEAAELVSALHREAEEYRERSANGMSLVAQWTQNGHRFLGNHYQVMQGSNALVEGYRVIHFATDMQATGLTGLKRATLNRTQTGVISNVAGQTQQELVIRWSPQESGDPPQYWLTAEGARKLGQSLMQAQAIGAQAMAQTGDPTAMQQVQQSPLALIPFDQAEQGAVQLTPEQGEAVQQMIAAGQLSIETLIVVNDKLRSDCAQEVFDNRWRMAQGDRAVVLNEYLCNIFGHQPLRFQWDDRKHGFKLENTHILNVWIDPQCDGIDEAEYVIFDHLLSADKAIAQWPEWEAEIRKAGETGPMSEAHGRRGAVWKNTDFQRPMVVVRTAWVRHQQIPMTVEQALAQGLVQPAMQEIVMGDVPAPEGEQTNPSDESIVESEGAPDPADPVNEGANTDAMGGQAIETDVSIPLEPMVTPVLDEDGNPVYQLVETGELTAPDNDNWPRETGLREIVTLPANETLLFDGPCAYSDIPMGWNVNIPIPYSPYGQGEPQRLEDLQQQINRLFSLMLNHAGFYQAPQRYWRASTLENLKRHNFQIQSRPGAEIPLPDNDYDRLVAQGAVCITQDIPILPPVYMQLFDRMLEEIDRMIGNVDVRQGITPTGVTSGKAIDSLRAEAAGPLAFKAKFTEWMLERIAKLALKAICDWMPESEWQRILSRYPLPVLREIIAGIDPEAMNVVAEVSTGRGTSREQEEQRATVLYANGNPGRLISRRSAMERVRIADPEAEARQIDEEDAKRAALAMPPAPQGETGGVA